MFSLFTKVRSFRFSWKKHNVIAVLIVICFIGIFLRTYKFHDWLRFELDQVRDATLVSQIVSGESEWPLLGPTMRGSGETKDALFRVGPAYPYFQIVSAKLFGTSPDVMAYPDLLFSLLSIPLFFFFFKRCFGTPLSLGLTGLYASSFFMVQYARFAWNPNPMPFFILLFLLSLHEFFVKREKTSIFFALTLGISLGVGIQLHVILLAIFLLTVTITTLVLLKKDARVWKKLAFAFACAFVLNIPQVMSEVHTGFSNTKILFFSSVGKDDKNDTHTFAWSTLTKTAGCIVEANTNILFAEGGSECNDAYVKIFKTGKSADAFRDRVSWPWISFGMIIFVVGIIVFIWIWRRTDDERKKFFFLVATYSSLSFVVMLSVVAHGFTEFRYFLPVFFVPFFLLGCIFETLLYMKKKRTAFIIAIIIGIIFFYGNIRAFSEITQKLSSGNGNDGHSVYLGEVDQVVQFIIHASNTNDSAYIAGKDDLLKNISRPMEYVAEREGFSIVPLWKNVEFPYGKPLFYISKKGKDAKSTEHVFEVGGFLTEHCRDFGKMMLCKVKPGGF